MKIRHIITRNLNPCLVITSEQVILHSESGDMPVEPSHLIPWRRDAHALRECLNADYDPRVSPLSPGEHDHQLTWSVVGTDSGGATIKAGACKRCDLVVHQRHCAKCGVQVPNYDDDPLCADCQESTDDD